ncbi:MAG: Gfo/Idh/MocA family oxidoreductase, partial [Thermoguttaceae bacterium]
TAVGSTPIRRDLMRKTIDTNATSGNGLGALYFGYGRTISEPVRVGVIGTGDEGSVLIGAINPEFIEVKSIADIRPYNVWRAFHGDCSRDARLKVRPGLMKAYGWKTEDQARENVKVYGAYEELIKNAKADKIEAVIIALPLHLHAPAAIAAMKAGLHVITEKLMGHSVHECKEMARVADQTNLLLATGHQRHYNILYNNAVDMIRQGLLDELHYIRAQWHRGDLPGHESWQQPMPKAAKPDDPLAGVLQKELRNWTKPEGEGSEEAFLAWKKRIKRFSENNPITAKLWKQRVAQIQAQMQDAKVDAKKYGYQQELIKDGSGKVVYDAPPIEELIRWRLWDRTSGGLMAELGSHQLDAAGIFIAAVHGGVKQMPLNVNASSSRSLFPADREVADHVFCVIEFPAPGYDPRDPLAAKKKIGVQYDSINGNGFGGYGETVLGTEGTLLLEREKDALLYRTHDINSKIKVAAGKKDAKHDSQPKLQIVDERHPEDPESASFGALGTLPADRGYTEELEHWAWCIRNRSPENLPLCPPKVALADAVIALTTNKAAREQAHIEFKKEWFDVDSDETPEGVKPDVGRY